MIAQMPRSDQNTDIAHITCALIPELPFNRSAMYVADKLKCFPCIPAAGLRPVNRRSFLFVGNFNGRSHRSLYSIRDISNYTLYVLYNRYIS